MMVSSQRCAQSTTLQWTLHAREWLLGAGEPCWQNYKWKVPSELCQYTLMTGMKWEDKVYVDKVLPFGLRSAQKLYNAVANALLWILVHFDGVDGLHYLDDFFKFLVTQTPRSMMRLCSELWLAVRLWEYQ